MFKYKWNQFNSRIGLIFMIGLFVTFILVGSNVAFSVVAAGTGGLLAWMPMILVPSRPWGTHIFGLVVYLVVGAALTWAAHALLPHQWLRLILMAVVTFTAYLLILHGSYTFMVAWCLVYWFLLAPLFLAGDGLFEVILGYIVGTGVVLVLVLVKPIWSRATRDAMSAADIDHQDEAERTPATFVVSYATIVSLSITAGLVAGMRWLTADPTLVANATLNMISPSLRQTWVAGVERIVMGGIGVIAGFYFGWFFSAPWVAYLVSGIGAFLALGALYVNMQLIVGILFFMVAYTWGVMHSDLAHNIANEKLLAEIVGVAIAIVAIRLLSWLHQRGVRRPN
jgi:hypothetical protein